MRRRPRPVEPAQTTPEKDATKLIRFLFGYAKTPDDPRRGYHSVSSAEVHESESFRGLPAERLNDAVKILVDKGQVTPNDEQGSYPYDTSAMVLTAQGRMDAERIEQRAQERAKRAERAKQGSASSLFSPWAELARRGDEMKRMAEDEKRTLLQLVDQVKTSGWFPRIDDFTTRENHAALESLASRSALQTKHGFYGWTGSALRLIKDDAFAAAELQHAVELLECLGRRFDEKKRDPVHVSALQRSLTWGSANDVRRAVHVLRWEFEGAVMYTRTTDPAGTGGVPEEVQVTEKIWKAKPELLLNGPPPKSFLDPIVPSPTPWGAGASAPAGIGGPLSTKPADAVRVGKEVATVMPDRKKVFVIHGRNDVARSEVGVFLRALGLEPLWFRDVRQGMGGTATIVSVVEHGMSLAQGVLALFTPDEFATLRPTLRKPGEQGAIVRRWQARPNVLFEAGMAFGGNRDRVAFVLFGSVELFTDASGIHVYWPTNEYGPDSGRAQLRGLLGGGMQCDINTSNDWMTAGDFDGVTKGLSDPDAIDPFGPPATGAKAPAPPAKVVKDDEALSLAKNWLRARPARSFNMSYEQLSAELPVQVDAEVLRRVLGKTTDGNWTIEAHEHSVVFTFHMPGPVVVSSPRRGF